MGALLCNSIQQTVRKTLNLAPAAGDKARTLLLRPMRGTHAKGSLAQIESRQIVCFGFTVVTQIESGTRMEQVFYPL